MNKKQKHGWWIDVTLFAGFITTFFLDLTGLAIHQWIGVFGGALAAYHLLTHWDWVSSVTGRFLRKTSGRARQYYLLDSFLLVGFAIIVVTGLAISTWLNLSLGNYTTWLGVHITASISTLVVLVLKLGLHWRWIANTTRSIFSPEPVRATLPAQPVRLATVPARIPAGTRQITRREFLEVMGVTGAVSLVALANGANSLKILQSRSAEASSQTSSPQASTSSQGSLTQVSTNSSVSESASSYSACTVSCNRGCSYPGHCRKYVDEDNNNYCDLGECA